MTIDELGILEKEYPKITADNLTNKKNRTLLYGFTCDRDTWHVYLFDMNIYVCKYAYGENPIDIGYICDEFVPDKRLYPARCDFEFCSLLKSRGIYLPFTTYGEKETVAYHDNGYYGMTLFGHSMNLPALPQSCA